MLLSTTVMPAMAATEQSATTSQTTEIVETVDGLETSLWQTANIDAMTSQTNGTLTFSNTNPSNTISESGTYTVTGSCAEGSLVIDKGLNVTLNMSDLNLSSSTTAPVVIKKGSTVNLVLSGTNTLTDKEDASTEDTNDAFEGACIKVKSGSVLNISGDGTLNADASSCKNGIKGAATSTITVDSGILNITSANTGLAADGEVIVNGGNVNITCENDGIKSEPDVESGDTESKGTVTINGGDINIKGADNGTDDESSDGIYGYYEANILGGHLTIDTGDDGIHSEYTTTIGAIGTAGPSINITNCTEGIEGATVNLNSGTANVVSDDDGINAANGDITGWNYAINIAGGTWTIDAEGDAIDSNGTLNVTGGTTEVYGPKTQSDNSAIDFDGQCTVTGGTLLGADNGGMMANPSTAYLNFTNAGISKGASVVIKNSAGDTIYETTGIKNANHVIFAAPDLSGQYTLYVNGAQKATATAGQNGTMPGGEGQPQPGQDSQMQAQTTVEWVNMPTKTTYTIGKDSALDVTGGQIKVTTTGAQPGQMPENKHQNSQRPEQGGFKGLTQSVSDSIEGALNTAAGVFSDLSDDNYAMPGQLSGAPVQTSTQTVDLDAAWCSGFDATKAGTQTITVTYPGASNTLTFDVTVKSAEGSGSSESNGQGSNTVTKNAKLYYRAHVQNIGWQNYDGKQWLAADETSEAGTHGKSLRMEAIEIAVPQGYVLSGYAHVQNIGNINVEKLRAVTLKDENGNDAAYDVYSLGTTGKSLRVEAVQIEITKDGGTSDFDLSYETHVQNIGWMGFVKSGELAGTQGQSLRMEAMHLVTTSK